MSGKEDTERPDDAEEIDEELRKALEADGKETALEKAEQHSQDAVLAIEAEVAPDGASPYVMMDRKDEEQILAELDGIPAPVLEEMVYSFTSGGGKVTGLSWTGTKALAIEAGHYSIDDLKISETPASFRVLARAKDINRNVAFYGVAEQKKMMKLRDGKEIEDPFALQKATSKAQRNALQALLPKKLVAEFMRRCLEKKRGGVRYS